MKGVQVFRLRCILYSRSALVALTGPPAVSSTLDRVARGLVLTCETVNPQHAGRIRRPRLARLQADE